MTHTLFLIDGAQVAGHALWTEMLEQLHAEGAALTLYSTEDQSLHALGPWLCWVNENQTSEMDVLFQKHPGYYMSALYLSEGHDWHALAKRWQTQFNRIDCASSKESYYLRYADVRVLEAITQVMNRSQWRAFTDGINQWKFMDRARRFKTLIPANQETQRPDGQLTWTDEQLASLLDFTWPDVLLAQVYELRPAYNTPERHAQQHAVACESHQQAQAAGRGDDTPYQVQLCLQALEQLQRNRKTNA